MSNVNKTHEQLLSELEELRRQSAQQKELLEENKKIIEKLKDSEAKYRTLSEQALEESEPRFRDLVENTSDWVWEVDEKAVYTYASPKVQDILGYSPEELLGKTPFDLMSAEEAQRVAQIFTPFITAKKPFNNLENTNIHKDGSHVVLETSGVPIFDKAGIFRGYRGIDRDISRRKKMQDELQKRERQLAGSQKVAKLGSWDLDIVSQELTWSVETYRLFDKDPEQFKPSFDEFARLVHPDDFETMQTAYKNALESDDTPYHVEIRIMNDSGREWVMEAFGEVVRDNKGMPLEIFGTAQDITKRKQMEDELSRSNQRLFTVLDSINALIYVADMQTYELLFINQYGKNTWGDVTGQICWKSLQQGQKGPCGFCTNKYLVDAGGHPTGIYTWEFQNTVDGRWYLIHDKAIEWEDGRLVRLEIATDITDRKKMEEELRAATMTDYLTGLLNRRGFFALAGQQCKLASRSRRAIALLYLDLDGFKHINDELGHEVGDQVLVETAKILKSTFREADIIARIGGDEFAVLLTDLPNSVAMNTINTHLQDNIRKFNEQGNRRYELIISSGAAYYDPEQPCSINKLLNKADNVMYHNKRTKEL
jgi:diguanylate cyclase (GGDEF)-like protein/PAS domain S-box-containing protein